MLYIPRTGGAILESNTTDTTNEFGVSVAAGSSAHTKNTTYTELVAATAAAAYGIHVGVGAVGDTPSTNTRTLVDIALGAASSEIVIIPNLLAGQTGAAASASSQPCYYYFPLYIPAGSRISATSQSVNGSDTVNVQIRLLEHPLPGAWYGQRVTAYGAKVSNSTGTSHTHGNNAYATTTQITASTTYPIKFLQVGIDLFIDTAGATKRGLLRIAGGGSTNYIASDLPYRESTMLEYVDFSICNFLLSHLRFNLPAGSYLGVGASMNAAGGTRGFILYGVD